MISSILCYVPPSVELSGPTTPKIKTRAHDPQFSIHIDAANKTSYTSGFH